MITKVYFDYFFDYQDGKMARLNTTGDIKIPFNMYIDNAEELCNISEGSYLADINGIIEDFTIFKSKLEYENSEEKMAVISMIPVGSFSVDSLNNADFKESPYILFSGEILKVFKNPKPTDNEYSHCIIIKTLEMTLTAYLDYKDTIKKSNIIHATAYLYGTLKPIENSNLIQSE